MSFHIWVMSTSCPKVPKSCPRSCITEAVTLLFKSSSNIRKFKEAPNGPMVSLRPHSLVTVLWWQEQNKRIEAEGQKLSPDLVYLKQCRIRNSLLFRWCLPIPELLKHRWMIDESKNKIIRVHRFMLIQLIQLHWHWTSRRILKYPKFLWRCRTLLVEHNSNLSTTDIDESVWSRLLDPPMPRYVGNACGTIACLHSIGNNSEALRSLLSVKIHCNSRAKWMKMENTSSQAHLLWPNIG